VRNYRPCGAFHLSDFLKKLQQAKKMKSNTIRNGGRERKKKRERKREGSDSREREQRETTQGEEGEGKREGANGDSMLEEGGRNNGEG
jgi:hypothetical protein